MGQFRLHDTVASRKEVHVVEAFFKNDARLQGTMALIIVIDYEKFVSFVFVDTELGEHLVLLNVLSWETDGVLHMAQQILLSRTQI